jgi:hypothetical protein
MAAGAPAAAQVGLGLNPMRLELRMAAGSAASGSLAVSNDSPHKVRIAAELLDFFIDETGTPQFARHVPAESGYSCRRWLTLNPMEAELPAGGQTHVRYSMRVPAGTPERSFHCAVGFTTQPTAEQAGEMGLRAAVRVVAAFYVITGEPQPDGALKRMRLEYAPDREAPGWRAVVVLENRGHYYYRPAGTLEVLSRAGQVIASADFIPLPALPEREQNYVFPLNLEPGAEYTLRARVDMGATEIQVGAVAVVAAIPDP